MESLTLTIAILTSLLVFCTKPVWSLVIYCAVMAWYPSYLTVKLGTIDFSACRIVILAIFTNLFLRTNLLKHYRFIWLDKLVIIYFTAQLIAGAATTPIMILLENRAGAIFDMVLPYFAVRIILKTKEQYLTLLKAVMVVAAPLAILGLYQSITSHNIVGSLKDYAAWETGGQSSTMRYGLYRATVTFSHPIMFGLFFAMFGPVCVGLFRSVSRNRRLYAVGIALMGVGAFSSLSTGPLLAALLAGGFLAFYRWRKNWKPVLTIIIVMCGILEVISNRHFYDVLGDFSLKSSAVWYRSKLVDVALFEGGMSGHWITGYGFMDPNWGPKIDGRGISDVVNHYLVILCRYGLVGLIPFLVMIVAAIKKLVQSYNICNTKSNRWLVWCLSAALFGILGAMNSVMLFGAPVTIFYVMVSLCSLMPTIVRQPSLQSFKSKTVKRINSNKMDTQMGMSSL